MKNLLSSPKISWDVSLFFALYVIAPSYCAVELSSKLPLITLSRALLILLGVMLVLRRRGDLFQNVRNLNFGLSMDPWLRRGLIAFFVILTVCDLVLLPSNASGALKAIFVLLMEGYMLIWLLSLILDTREKIEAGLRLLVIVSGVTALIVIAGCIHSVHPFHILNLVEREMPMTFEYRLGLMRAEAGFGHPCYYGAFCAIMLPVNMYYLEYSEKNWERKLFALCLVLNITGVILSNARGSFLTFGCVVLIAAAWSLVHKEFKKFLRTYVPVGCLALIVLIIVSVLSPVGIGFLLGFIKSILEILPNVSLDFIKLPESVMETMNEVAYGLNEQGLNSRAVQWSGIEWTLARKPLFGFGHNAHAAGLISYEFMEDVWVSTMSFDVGVVAVIGQYGLVGLLGYLAFFGSVLKESLSRVCFRDPLMRYLGFAVVIYLVHLLTIASLDKLLWVIIASIVCLSNVIRRENQFSA